jgi:hypothetical protein
MNERINTLAEQATVTRGRMRVVDVEKFAELIVRECARVCSNVSDALSAEPIQSNFGAAQTCLMAIKQHFGVKP